MIIDFTHLSTYHDLESSITELPKNPLLLLPLPYMHVEGGLRMSISDLQKML